MQSSYVFLLVLFSVSIKLVPCSAKVTFPPKDTRPDSCCINAHFLHGRILCFPKCYIQTQISHLAQPSISKASGILKWTCDQPSKFLQGKILTERSHPERSAHPSSSLAGGNSMLTLKNISKIQAIILPHAKFESLICLSNSSQPFKEVFFFLTMFGGIINSQKVQK